MKIRLLLIIIILETLIIVFAVVEKPGREGVFIFDSDTGTPFEHSFSFVFSKSKKTHGFVALGREGDLSSVFLEDKDGRLITFGFDDGNIVSYTVRDKKYNYAMETFFLKESEPDGNIIISREEMFNGQKQHYFLDYTKSPFIFSEIPPELKDVKIDMAE